MGFGGLECEVFPTQSESEPGLLSWAGGQGTLRLMWPEERLQVSLCFSFPRGQRTHRARSESGPLFTSYSDPALHTDSVPCGQHVAELPGISFPGALGSTGAGAELGDLGRPWASKQGARVLSVWRSHSSPPCDMVSKAGAQADLACSEAGPAGLCLSGGRTPPVNRRPPRLRTSGPKRRCRAEGVKTLWSDSWVGRGP